MVHVCASGDDFDLVCDDCGERSRLHPDESLVEQVELFVTQHRHGPAG